MQYDLELAVRRNWALLKISDYQEAFFEMFGFAPSKKRIRYLISKKKIDIVKHEGKVYIVMNDKSTYDIKPSESDYVVFKRGKYAKPRFMKIKEAMGYNDGREI